jgi:hypothetical protein
MSDNSLIHKLSYHPMGLLEQVWATVFMQRPDEATVNWLWIKEPHKNNFVVPKLSNTYQLFTVTENTL